jgi:hypothetical protein
MRVGTARCASAVGPTGSTWSRPTRTRCCSTTSPTGRGSTSSSTSRPTARYDLTCSSRSRPGGRVGLHRLHAERGAAAGAALFVLGNKTSDGGDAAWLTEQIGDALLGCVGHSAWVRAAERGTAGSVSGFEPGNTVALAAVRSALDARPRKLQQGGPMSGHPAEVERAYSASRR